MLYSLSLVFLVGLGAAALCRKCRLPGLLGMLLAGIALGPCGLNWLDASLLNVSSQLRQGALILILLRAGLSLSPRDVKKVGRPAVLMSCVPAACEILGYVLLAPRILGLSRPEAAVMGAVMAAVSPAVVVPRMLQLMRLRRGTDKGVPQLIMAGASCDDIFVVVLFSSFVTMAQGGSVQWTDLLRVPVSILLGIALGALLGALLSRLSPLARNMRGSVRALALLSVAMLLPWVEDRLSGIVPVSGLLAAVSMAFVLKCKLPDETVREISNKYETLWIPAEALLFVLVGAAVDVQYALAAGPGAAALILLALAFRMAGVLLCLVATPMTAREKLFCAVVYLPKATVQAAIGSVPLSMGLPCGNLVLSVAVLSILITAPLGALGIDLTAPRLLRQETDAQR